jgi:curved DNA-binding protein CbpA
MGTQGFVDYYEVLQVNASAEAETISRIYRHLAKRYHPDNPETGDRAKFDELAVAHETLIHPEKRAAYDLLYDDAVEHRLRLLDEAIALGHQDDDELVRDRLLAVLYTQRRRDVEEPSAGEVHLERTLGVPREHLAFHIWYLKEKQWIERTDRGFAITAAGIDVVEAARRRSAENAPAQLAAGSRVDGDGEAGARTHSGRN